MRSTGRTEGAGKICMNHRAAGRELRRGIQHDESALEVPGRCQREPRQVQRINISRFASQYFTIDGNRLRSASLLLQRECPG